MIFSLIFLNLETEVAQVTKKLLTFSNLLLIPVFCPSLPSLYSNTLPNKLKTLLSVYNLTVIYEHFQRRALFVVGFRVGGGIARPQGRLQEAKAQKYQ